MQHFTYVFILKERIEIKLKKITKVILLLICLVIFIYSAYNIYNYIKEENANKQLNAGLIKEVITINQDINQNEEKEENKNNAPINVDFSLLKEKNQDIVGWIYFKDTPINYPVVQAKDNQYYLHRLINGEYNASGSIFMDYRNDPNLEDNNTIIYGHNMKSDEMFGTLQNYKNQEYYENHKIIYYFTQEKNYEIKLVAGYTVSLEDDIYNLNEINQEQKEKILQKSDFKSDVNISQNDKLITLSTCSYEYEDARYILIGILNEI